MDGWFWSSAIVAFVGLIGLLLYLIISHFMPLYLKLGVAPKGSFGWPLVGETLSFLSPHASNTLGSFLQDHCNRYGKVFKSHLFCSPTVVSCDQELNNFILQNEEKLFQCSYPKPIHGILGTSSMLVVVGDTHKRLRSLALTLVSTTKSKPEYLNDIERIAIQIMDAWKDKKEVIFCEEARKFTFNVIVKQVLGLTPEEPQTSKILEDFLTFMKGLISFPLYIPGTPYARAVQARARISSTVKAIVEERRSKGENSAGNKKSDFLEILLSANSLSEDERVSFVLDSLLGGYETTSLLMALAVLFLGQSPAALQQLRSEHESIRNVKGKEEYLNWDDYKKMEFSQHVINEALRCGNIVKFVHQKALKDVRFKDYSIPCGWKVLPVFSAVHLDTSLHGSVLDFHPWRWENQSQSTCKIFTPFGGGHRFCPGSELAKVETSFFLHHLVLNFSLQALGGLGAGIIALRYPGILYWGFTNVDEILRMGKSASAPGIWLLTQLVGAKVVATALCRGSGLVGALYALSLMIGAALGAVFGGSAAEIINSAIPGNVAVAQPQAYALVGIAATLASVCSVPLTSVLLLFELTKDYRILLALMARLQVPETVVQQIFLLNSLDVELYKHGQEDIFAQQQTHLAEKLDKVFNRIRKVQ